MITLNQGPLQNIRVLDIGRFIAGPVTATILAEFGADVIKIEKPVVGDELRKMGPIEAGKEPAWWLMEGRNKRCITLDIATRQGQEVLFKLVKDCDILIENFKPKTMERWGLGVDVLQGINPSLIVLRTSGYGQSGSRSGDAGLNTAAEAMGGLRHLVGYPGDTPLRPGVSMADYLAALFGAIGVLAALHERETVSGKGQWIDNSLYEAVLRVLEWTAVSYSQGGGVRDRAGASDTGAAPARAYPTGDSRWIAIAVGSDGLFKKFAEAMDKDDLSTSDRFETNAARVRNEKELSKIISDWTLNNKAQYIEETLRSAGVPACIVMSIDNIIKDPHVAERKSFVNVTTETGDQVIMQGITPRLSRTPGLVTHAGQSIGSSNDDVYLEYLSNEEYAELQKKGII